MKYILIFISLCFILPGGTDWPFSSVSFAESDIDVIGTTLPEYEEDEPVADEITQEMIDKEEEWLEQKIDEINETSIEKFGSLILKQKKRAYYIHRLELLRDSPEQYFKTKADK